MCENSHFKRHQLLHDKVRPVLLQNASAFFVTEYYEYKYEMQQLFYIKVRKSSFITKCVSFFLLKSATSSVISSALDILVRRSYKVRRNKPKALDIPHCIHIFSPLYSVPIFSQVGIPPGVFC